MKTIKIKALSVLAAAAALLPVCAKGDIVEGVWTGAKDSFWTNANNWAGGVVPGRYLTSDGAGGFVTNGVGCCTATFGEIAEGAAAVIDFDGLLSVTNITVTGATRRFTLGTSSAQQIPIESGGSLVVAAGAKVPVLAGALLLGANTSFSYWNSPTDANGNTITRPGVYVENYSSETLEIGDYGPVTAAQTTPNVISTEVLLQLEGTGSVRIKGSQKPYRGSTLNGLHIIHALVNPAKLSIASDVEVREVVTSWSSSMGTALVEIEEGGSLGSYSNMGTYGFLNLGRNTHFYGAGVLRSITGVSVQSGVTFGIIAANAFFTGNFLFDVRVETGASSSVSAGKFPKGFFIGKYASANVEFTNSDVTGRVMVAQSTLKTRDVGADGWKASFGDATPFLHDSGRLMYTGPGETSTRTIVITNGSQQSATSSAAVSAEPTGILEQAGSGVWNVASPLSLHGCSEGACLTLANSVAVEGVFSGVLADGPDGKLNLVKTGTGEWKLAAMNTYTGTTTIEGGVLTVNRGASITSSSGVLLKGGNLNFEAGDETVQVSSPAITLVSGTSAVTVGANVQLTVPAIVQSGTDATIDFLVPSFPVKIMIEGLEDGDAPAYITVNGVATTYSAETGLAIPVEEGTGRWGLPVYGDWTDSDKWISKAVPQTEDDVYFSVYGTDYVARVTSALTVGGLLSVSNPRNGSTATVAVSNKLDFSSGSISLGEGGRVSIGEGGELYFNNSAETTVKFTGDISEITAGGELEIDGGCATFTNFNGRFRVSGTSEAPGVFRLKSGRLMLVPRIHDTSDKWSGIEELSIQEHGRFIQTGGTNDIYAFHGGNSAILMRGGSVDVSGDSVWRYTHGYYSDAPGTLIGGRFVSGTGEMTFRDNAVLGVFDRITDGMIFFKPNSKGDTVVTEFRDHAKIDSLTRRSGSLGSILLGGVEDSRTILRMYSDAFHGEFNTTGGQTKNTVAYKLVVGDGYGTSIFEMTNGVFALGAYGVFAGVKDTASIKKSNVEVPAAVTGIVHIAGGTMRSASSGSVSPQWTTTTFYGDQIGSSYGQTEGHFFGRLIMDGGEYIGELGNLLIGYGLGEGEWLQNGGTTTICSVPTYSLSTTKDGAKVTIWATNNVFAVGCAGGKGTFMQKGGDVLSNLRIFVGGATTNEFITFNEYSEKYGKYLFDYTTRGYGERHGAEGYLGVHGGTFTANKFIMVGEDGKGVVEIGPTGTLHAVSLVLTNNAYTAEGEHAATLKFTFGENGIGSANVTNLVIAEGAALEVDMRAYVEGGNKSSRIRLLKAANVQGSFDADNITLLMADEKLEAFTSVVTTPGGIDVRISRGTVFLFR